MSRIIEAGIPIVCLDRVPDRVQVDSVCVDDLPAAEMGVEHLIQRGYRRIAIVTGPLTLKNERRRMLGYKRCLTRAGIPLDEKLIWHGNLRSEDVAAMCRERLGNAAGKPDALFCTNGPTALGALEALRDCGLTTPGDIGFVTFDELTAHDLFTPAITTIVQPAYEIGCRASEILLRRIAQGSERDGLIAVRLPATLRVRASSSGRADKQPIRPRQTQ
jgi:DNA-binding LacI/PurR family transcriptional regulator